MKETRKLLINKKVFRKINIEDIGKMLQKEYEDARKQKRHTNILYTVICSDDTTYESEAISIFDDGGITDIKKIKSIEISFRDYDLNRYIFFSVSEGNSNSLIRISGDDTKWVSNAFIALSEYIESIKPQESFFIKYKEPLKHIVALGFGKIWLKIIGGFLSILMPSIKNPSEVLLNIREVVQNNILIFNIIFEWIIPWIVGLSFMSTTFHYLYDFWPNIEFDFDPEHLKLYKNRRSKFNTFLTLIIIPTTLMIVYDIIKSFLR